MISATESRERYLSMLRALPYASSARIKLCDGRKVDGVTVTAVRPDSSALLVRRLETPLGILPAAVLRGGDIVAVEATFDQAGPR